MSKIWDKGQGLLAGPEDGMAFDGSSENAGTTSVKFSRHNCKNTAFAMGKHRLKPGESTPRRAFRLGEGAWFVLEGEGEVTLDGQTNTITEWTTIYAGRWVPFSFTNTGNRDLVLAFFVTPPGPERALSSLPSQDDPEGLYARTSLATDAEIDRDNHDKGQSLIVAKDEGDAHWQGPTANGYVITKLSPRNLKTNAFALGIQVLPAGCAISEHAHKNHEEILFALTANGSIAVNGEKLSFPAGTAAYVSRWVKHSVINDTDDVLTVLWYITPPGLENFFSSTGVLKNDGDPAPEAVVYPPELFNIFYEAGMVFPQDADNREHEAAEGKTPRGWPTLY